MLAGVLLHPLVLAQTILTFTNADVTGTTGPTQAQVTAAYDGTTLDDAVNINTIGIQEWTVPATAVYTIEVTGASGGSGTGTNSLEGGNGARMRGNFSLNAGEVIKILVGQRGGSDGGYHGNENGGGGGTFVVKNDNTPLIIAGGGGGGPSTSYGTN